MRRAAVAFALLAACTTAAAMEFRTVGSTLVMSGPMTSHDLAQLKDHLAAGHVKLVLLHASSGGDLWNGLQMGERIREEGPPALLERTVYIAHAQDIVYIYHPAVQGSPSASGVVACLHAEGQARSCEPVEGMDALSIGVLTQREVMALDPAVKALLQPVAE